MTPPPVCAVVGLLTDVACKSDTAACRPFNCQSIVLDTGPEVLFGLGWYTVFVALVTMNRL